MIKLIGFWNMYFAMNGGAKPYYKTKTNLNNKIIGLVFIILRKRFCYGKYIRHPI